MGTVGGLKARQYTRCPAASFECPMTAEFQVIDLEIPAELAGQRLDSALARLLPEHSRTRIKGWIEAGAVKLDRGACKPRDLVEAGSRVRVQMTTDAAAQPQVLPEAIALRVVHEDRDVLVIDKPAGLVVHPGAGNPQPYPAKCLAGAGPLAGGAAARGLDPPAGQGHQRPAGGGAHARRRRPRSAVSWRRAPWRANTWRCAWAS